jgi:tetratricopeptide (TPR) repeat protein
VSEGRLREQLGRETTDTGRAEVLTQLARVEGLRGDFDGGERLLADAEALGGAETRVELERGRLLRSKGEPEASLPFFERAFELAVRDGDGFLAADAGHMAALAGDVEAWTDRTVVLAAASADPEVRYWLGPLANNLGWARYESGDHDGALAAFEDALDARARDLTRPHEREIARYAVAKALHALGRPGEAVALLEQAVAWAEAEGIHDEFFETALAEARAATTAETP